jgi:hypothetical protein
MYTIQTDNGPVDVREYGAINATDLQKIADAVHAVNAKWWKNPATGEPIVRNVGEMLMLVNTELSEAMEGHRRSKPGKPVMDDHLLEREQFEVEIMDAFIRLFDLAGGLKLDFKALVEKMAYNGVRKDHTNEARLAEGGKAY